MDELLKPLHWLYDRASEASTLAGLSVCAVSFSVVFSLTWISWIALGLGIASVVKNDPSKCSCNK